VIVLDTSALLFWTLDPANLSQKAQDAIEQAARIVVSAISVWEIGLKVKRRKLVIPLSIHDYADRLERLESLEIMPVDDKSWLENLDLPWEHRDPADRTIVAIATRYACPIVSPDQVMADFYPETIW
jgi:PIN domain nuclease of toxin-antitoxin system